MANVLRHALVNILVTILMWILGVFALPGEDETVSAGNRPGNCSQPVSIVEGENLVLVTHSFREPVQWFKDGHDLDILRRHEKEEYDKLHAVSSWNKTTGENILSVYNVSPIHSGNYSCQRENHYPDGVSKHFFVIVNVQSKNVSQPTNYNRFKGRMGMVAKLPLTVPAGNWSQNSVNVVSLESYGTLTYNYFANRSEPEELHAGRKFEVHCLVEGHPDSPDVYWDKNGKNLREWQNNRVQFGNHNLVLLIEEIQCSDAGSYTCTVNTTRGPFHYTRDLTVKIGVELSANIDKYNCQKDEQVHRPTTAVVGQELKLECIQKRGHSDLRIGRVWQKRESNNPTCDNPEPYIYSNIPGWNDSIVYVKTNVTHEDAGTYRCLAGEDLSPTAMPPPDFLVYCVNINPAGPSIHLAETPSVSWTVIVLAILLAVLLTALTGYLLYRRVKPQPDSVTQSASNQMQLANTSSNPTYPYPWLEILPDTPEHHVRRALEAYSGSESSEDAGQMESLINDEPSGSLLMPPPEASGLVRVEIKIGQFKSSLTIDPDDEAFVPPERLRLTNRLLGKGAFGEVWEGTLLGETDTVRVAAKRLNEKCVAQENLHEIIQECRLMQSMEPHENVLRCLGFCITSKNLHLLTEFAANGNLKTYMEHHKNDVQHWSYERPLAEDFLTPSDLLNFSWQIAKGMRYLAEIKIVHRDLAARNVLVNEQKILKIADFGLSRRMTSKNYYRLRKQKRLPMKWMAPESLTQCIFDSKSDVWSFGVVMWEIAAFGQEPYKKLFMEKNIVPGDHLCMASILRNNVRLPALSHATSEMYSIMQSCWTYDAERRPAFPELEQQLNALCNSDEQIHSYTLLCGPSRGQNEGQDTAGTV